MTDLNVFLALVWSFLALAGNLLIAAGLLKFFGVNIPLSGSGLELAVAGYLMKAI